MKVPRSTRLFDCRISCTFWFFGKNLIHLFSTSRRAGLSSICKLVCSFSATRCHRPSIRPRCCVAWRRRSGKQLLPDLASSFVSMHRTTMPETTSSEIWRKRKTNSFSVMVPSCPGPTWLRGLGTCPRWTGLNMSASQERVASYILFGIFLRQHIVFNCFTFSFSFGPCLGLFVMDLSDTVLSKATSGSLAALCDTTRFWALPVFTSYTVSDEWLHRC